MRCLSCQQEVANKDAKLVLQLYLCPGCGAMADKAVKELERETARALEIAKATLSEMIMRGGLLHPKNNNFPEDEITREMPVRPSSKPPKECP